MTLLRGKRIVIFGCGYVGSAVARAALADGARVVALTRNQTKAAELRAAGVEVVVAELTEDAWPKAIEGGADVVVNCVSASSYTPEGYRVAYVDGMRSILRWAAERGAIGTFVYTSSTGVYPQGGGAQVEEPASTAEAGPMGSVLVEAEKLLLGARGPVRRAFVLRLAGIYGPGRHALLDQLRAGVEVINGRGEHRLNLVHRDDVAGAIRRCAAAPSEAATGVFNLSDGNPAAKAEVVGWLAAQLGRVAPRFDASAPSTRRGGAGVPDRIIVSERIRRELGWVPEYPSYREGYAAILRGEV